MLNLYRRHKQDCPHQARGRECVGCSCPIWCDGELDGKRVRHSLDTVNWQRAVRKLAELENPTVEVQQSRKAIANATETFLESKERQPGTLRKYRRLLRALGEFAQRRGLGAVSGIRLEHLDAYRKERNVNALTWSKELHLLRQFFGFCVKRKWCEENPARDMEMPTEPKPAPREPFTGAEMSKILAACDTFGRAPYERLRARAMILLMRFYGLRVSDVATLERSRVRDGHIFLHALKNGAPIWLPLYQQVEFALSCVPAPRGAPVDCPYVFWNGAGSMDVQTRNVKRTLQAVFTASGVQRAFPHRYRHTLATEILASGGTIEDAANILGDTPAIVAKHYLKWSTAYQTRTVEVLARVHGTSVVHEKNAAVTPGESGGWTGGPGEIRTHDLFHAMEARSQLRHRPIF